MTPYRDETSLRSFQEVTAAKYAADEVKEVKRKDGANIGIIVDGSFKMEDTYFSNEDEVAQNDQYNAIFNGQTVISHNDTPIWIVRYDASIRDPQALEFYYNGVMNNPDKNLPFLGKQGLIGNGFEYTYKPHMNSKLLIGHFAVEEAMRRISNGSKVYNGFSTGGWTT